MPRSNSSFKCISSKLSTTSFQLLSINPLGSMPAGPLLYDCSSSPLRKPKRKKKKRREKECQKSENASKLFSANSVCRRSLSFSISFLLSFFRYYILILLFIIHFCFTVQSWAMWCVLNFCSRIFFRFKFPVQIEEKKNSFNFRSFFFFFVFYGFSFLRKRWPWANLYEEREKKYVYLCVNLPRRFILRRYFAVTPYTHCPFIQPFYGWDYSYNCNRRHSSCVRHTNFDVEAYSVHTYAHAHTHTNPYTRFIHARRTEWKCIYTPRRHKWGKKWWRDERTFVRLLLCQTMTTMAVYTTTTNDDYE